MVDEIEKIVIPRYREIEGNLIAYVWKGEPDIIGHGANCMKLMGAGIAAQIRRHFPEAYKVDQDDTRRYYERLGDFSQADVEIDKEGNSVKILNIYSQEKPGPDFDPTALRLSLRKINRLFPDKSIYLPLIGCGIGGGDWLIVQDIIKEELSDMFVTIVHFKK